jgi:hypothetical protein
MDLTPLKEAFKDFPAKAKEALKNFPEFLKGSFKIYPLLVMTISASLVLAIVFAFMKDGSDSSVVTPAPVVTTTASNEQSLSSGVTSVSGDTSFTETAPVPVREFQTVDDAYFHDALFIGNSRTVGLSMFGSMPEETTFYATVGMNIFDLMGSSAQIPPEEGPEQSFASLMSEKQFGKIYIMLGINDLGTGTNESFAEYYKGVIDQIHQLQPDAIIYIQSIINVSAARDAQGDYISNAVIDQRNALIKELADNDYCFYLNVNEVLVDANGCLNADYTSDGIHLGGGSLSIWEDYLYSHAIVK